MKFLLIAYEFPPLPSPQSLRWAYLARELVAAGHQLQAVVPAVVSYGGGGLPPLPAAVVVHRVYPGPLSSLINIFRNRLAREVPVVVPAGAGSTPQAHSPSMSPQLNWKGKLRRLISRRLQMAMAKAVRIPVVGRGALYFWDEAGRRRGGEEVIQLVAAAWIYPDTRAEWKPWARKKIDRVLQHYQPDVVISSHEPPSTIELGRHAKRQGFFWSADLGDPVLAAYTSPRWRERAMMLERQLCEEADMITVTAVATAAQLRGLYQAEPGKFVVLTQGYDTGFAAESNQSLAVAFDPAMLELLYTGSFYAFRRASALIEAIIKTPGLRLNIATIHAPAELVAAACKYPERFRLLGFLPHKTALQAQRACDVLVNIANADPVQVPGKLYEYLGSGTPILHIGGSDSDAARELVAATGAGWCVEESVADIAQRLATLVQTKAKDKPMPVADAAEVRRYSWTAIAGKLVVECMRRMPA